MGIVLVLLSLWLAPVCMYFFWRYLEKSGRSTKKYWRYGPVLATLTTFVLLICMGYGGFDELDRKITPWLLWYALYCLATVSLRALPWRQVRGPALFLCSLFIVFVSSLSIFAAFGFVLFSDMADQEDEPFHVQQMSSDIACRAWYFGWAGSDSGHNIKLYRRSPNGAEQELAKASVIHTDPGRNDPDTPSSCDELYAQYLAKHAASKQ